MRNDKAGGSGKKHGAGDAARVDLHPSAGKAASGLMSAMAVEFDRWMADEVEELAESISVIDGAETSPHVRAHLRQLAEQLARQAETLGYPDIVQVATRLSKRFGSDAPAAAADPGSIDEQIAELRALLKK
jgi:HPt (histidine-containing phosphotransfer) domain-containing protein